MDLTYCKKFNIKQLFIIGVGVLLTSAFLFSFIAQAQTDANHEAQVKAAIEDLSATTGQSITSEEEAKKLCNLEQYLDVCADVGKKHDLYTPEEEKHVDDFLTEVKGKILDDIKACPDDECLIRVANELAAKIKTKNPTLAADFKLTTTLIEEKNSVVQAAKEAGVDFRDCEAMDPDTASIELLRQCAKLAKDSRVQKYIPEEKRVLADQFSDTTLVLREGLKSGKYQCGDNTLEGCGNYCLDPSVASIGAGIPEVCKQIAAEVFGPDGVKQLESAHQQVGQVRDYYSKKFILTLPDGKELVGEGQIRNACDQAFSGRNLEIARACGAFAVQNGFAAQAEVDKGLKLMESFAGKAQNVNFDECLTNPRGCRDFIPEEERNKFDAGNQIFEIMRTEIGFDPSQCERGSIDQTIGDKCFEGSKRALDKITSLGLADQSPEARFIIEDIRRHVSEGDNLAQRREQFKEVFSQQGGPGGCKSEAECFTYCSNPTNGPECISFGAQQGVSGFRGNEAIQKFQEYNQNIQKSEFISNDYRPYPSDNTYPQYPGQGPYPPYPPPGQVPGFNQPGPGFSPPPGTLPFYPPFPGGQGPGPAGPSPECFAAIQSGDFVKAKAVCEVNAPTQPYRPGPICPAAPYVQCPAGEYRESSRNNDGCWVDGPCKPAPTYSSGPYPTYSSGPYPTYSSGPYPSYSSGPYPTYSPGSGGWINKSWKFKDGNTQSSSILNRTDSEYTSYVNGVYSDCLNKYFAGWKPGGGDNSNWQEFGIPVCSSTISTSPSPYPTYSPYPTGSYPSCPSGQWWDTAMSKCTATSTSCGTGYYWDSVSSMCKPSGSPGPSYSPYPTYSPPVSGSCPSGYHYHGESGGFCMNDREDYSSKCYNSAGTSTITCPIQPSYTPTPSCPSGQYWDSATSSCKSNNSYGGCTGTSQSSCTSVSSCYWNSSGNYCYYQSYSGTPMPSCPSGQWWDTAMSKCTSTAATYTPTPSCPSGQWWDYQMNKCTSTTSCGTGYYWDSASSMCKPSGGTSYTPTPSCPSGQYWAYSSSSCKSNTSYGDCTGTTQSSCISISNCYWNSGSNYCYYQSTSPGTATYTPYPSCPSGQWWDSSTSSCKTTSSTDCPSGWYWNGSSCVSSGTTYIPPYPTSTYTYTPPPSCASGQWWDSSTNSCQGSATTYTPYPTTQSTPYPTMESTPYPTMSPTSSLQNPYMIAHCQELDRTWNGSNCRANGLFARFYEYYVANVFQIFSLTR